MVDFWLGARKRVAYRFCTNGGRNEIEGKGEENLVVTRFWLFYCSGWVWGGVLDRTNSGYMISHAFMSC